MCYETGQFYLLLTRIKFGYYVHDIAAITEGGKIFENPSHLDGSQKELLENIMAASGVARGLDLAR